MGSENTDVISKMTSQESPIQSAIDKADSLADIQHSTEKDFSFISQTESKVLYDSFLNITYFAGKLQ